MVASGNSLICCLRGSGAGRHGETGETMADLTVSWSTLEAVHGALDKATSTFTGASLPAEGGASGAEDVAQAFATFRTAQQRSDEWLADTSRTLGEYAKDTKSLFADADDDLSGKAGGK